MRTEFNTWLGSRSKMTLSPIIFYPSSSDLFLESYIVKIAVEAAPLMCAGITTYNALRNNGARAEDVVAILGIGGLGHLGIQFAAKMGFNTIAIGRSKDKEEELAKKLGAKQYIDNRSQNAVEEQTNLEELNSYLVLFQVERQ